MPVLLAAALKLAGLYRRGQKNASAVELRRNIVSSAILPRPFDGFAVLHLSDLHADTNLPAMDRVAALIPGLHYDLCVWTGDYRGRTFGDYLTTVKALAQLREFIAGDIFAVLGNHDTIEMVPHLEKLGIRMLLNEAVSIVRGDDRLHLAGIDDAHYFRVDNIEKASAELPPEEFSILLSHTPEIYRQAAHAGFDLMLCGHTHGGQICLPGSIPLTLDAVLPRQMGAGAWRYRNMLGYTSRGAGTSIVPVRFHCPPEITLHEFRCAPLQ